MKEEFEALKRIRQETAPATYNPDFDKNQACDAIEQSLKDLILEKVRDKGVWFYPNRYKIRKEDAWPDQISIEGDEITITCNDEEYIFSFDTYGDMWGVY